MYSGSADQCIKLWDLEQFDVVSTIEAHDNPVCTLTVGGDRLYSGSLKTIKVCVCVCVCVCMCVIPCVCVSLLRFGTQRLIS